MNGQEKRSSQKKRGRPATGRGILLGVRLQPELLAQIDHYIQDENASMSRQVAIRRLIERALQNSQ
jgi:hypothetical protein